MEPIVRVVDHVVITSSDPATLFGLLAGPVGLPVVWPMLDFGGYMSGGVCVGNANLEIARAGADDHPTAASGLVFAPGDLAASVAELDRRGLPHSPPDPYAGDSLRGTPALDPATPPGTRLWTVVWLAELSGPGYAALCDYNRQVLKPTDFFAAMLRAQNGGALGISGLREIVIGAADAEAAGAQWQLLLDPATPAPAGRWALGGGPDLVLVPAARDGIQRLVFTVRSRAEAQAALSTAGLLGEVTADSVQMAPERVQGLDIRLV